jgi:hypothetical protein
MKSLKRGLRLRDKERMKRRAVRIFAQRGVNNPNNIKLADHIAHCSGSCCGNPRKWFNERTMQERRYLCEVAQ